jgi:hypothetical protein
MPAAEHAMMFFELGGGKRNSIWFPTINNSSGGSCERGRRQVLEWEKQMNAATQLEILSNSIADAIVQLVNNADGTRSP